MRGEREGGTAVGDGGSTMEVEEDAVFGHEEDGSAMQVEAEGAREGAKEDGEGAAGGDGSGASGAGGVSGGSDGGDSDGSGADNLVALEQVHDTINPLLDGLLEEAGSLKLKEVYQVLRSAIEPHAVDEAELRSYVKEYLTTGLEGDGGASDSSSSGSNNNGGGGGGGSGSESESESMVSSSSGASSDASDGAPRARKKKKLVKRRVGRKASGRKPAVKKHKKAAAEEQSSEDDEGDAPVRLLKSISGAKALRRYCRAVGVDVARLGGISVLREDQLDSALRVLKRLHEQLVEQQGKAGAADAESAAAAEAFAAYCGVSTMKFCQLVHCTGELEPIRTHGELARCAEATYLLKEMLEGDALAARFCGNHERAYDFLQGQAGLEAVAPGAWAAGLGLDASLEKRVDLAFNIGGGSRSLERQFAPWQRPELGEPRVLFAVRPAGCVAGILAHGFRPYSAQGPMLSAARGLVFFDTVDAAVEHFSGRTCLKGPAASLYVFAAKVACGKVLAEASEPSHMHATPPKGFHSVRVPLVSQGGHQGGDDSDEQDAAASHSSNKWLVFDQSQVLPVSFARLAVC